MACNENPAKKVSVEDVYTTDSDLGGTEILQTMVDSDFTGTYQLYHVNGNVWREAEFVNGVLNGRYTIYQLNGFKKCQLEYLDGQKHGRAKYYGKTGNLQSSQGWLHDKIFGSSIDYYLNGNFKRYSFYDFQSNLRYQIVYDSLNQNIMEENGTFLGQFLLNGSFEEYSVMSNLRGSICVASPPKRNVVLKVLIIKDSVLLYEESFDVTTDYIEFDYKALTIGQYQIYSIAEMRDSATGKVSIDTIVTSVNVIEGT